MWYACSIEETFGQALRVEGSPGAGGESPVDCRAHFTTGDGKKSSSGYVDLTC